MTPAAHMAEFRQWDRRVREWTRGGSRVQRLRARVLRPAKVVRQARRSLARVGADIEAVAGVPRWRQLLDLVDLRLRYDLTAQAYADYQLYRPERRAQAALFVDDEMHARLARVLDRAYAAESDGPRIFDKGQLPMWCREHGLLGAPTLVEWDDGAVVRGGLPAGELPPCDLFSKPPDASQGWGTARWTYDGVGGYMGRDGRARTAQALLAELAAASRTLPRRPGWPRYTRLVLMRALANHPYNAPLTNGALCTARIVTYRAPGEKPAVLVAVYRMAVGNAQADNFHNGGLLASVDLPTGHLGPGIRRRGHAIVSVERHPDTGAPIAGHVLAGWSDALATALRAHAAARACPVVGWDVGMTPDGPVLIEANRAPSQEVTQAPSGVPIGATPYIAALNAHLRLVAARGRSA